MNTDNISNPGSKPVERETVATLVRLAGHMSNIIAATRSLKQATGEEEAARCVDEALERRARGGPAAG